MTELILALPFAHRSRNNEFPCLCCRFVTALPLGETISPDEDRMCAECSQRAQEKPGVDYDAEELGGES